MSVLVVADHDLGALSATTARVVDAAKKLGPVDLLVVGENLADIAKAGATLDGVAKVRVLDSAALANPGAETLAPVLADLSAGYEHIVMSAAALGRDTIPRLAAMLDLMPVTDVIAIHGVNRFDRPIYAGNAIETVVSNQPKHLLTIRASAFRAVPSHADAPVEALGGSSTVGNAARFIAAHRTESDVPDLSTARVVVGGGQSVKSSEGFKLIEQLAARLGAAVGATRAAVDLGYAPNDWQVGQTGKIIAPDLYIAIGISGALQHLAGIQGTKKIVAINTDPEAPIMKLADVALVGDLFSVVPELLAELDRLGV